MNTLSVSALARRDRSNLSAQESSEPAGAGRIGKRVKNTLSAAALCAAFYFIPEWNWAPHFLWWAIVLTLGAAWTAAVGFFVLRWLVRQFPDEGRSAPMRSGSRTTVHRPMSCLHLRIRQFSTISAVTVWTKDETGSYLPDDAITKVLDEETERWECADCGESVSPDLAP